MCDVEVPPVVIRLFDLLNEDDEGGTCQDLVY
jgi:hypothetical protein